MQERIKNIPKTKAGKGQKSLPGLAQHRRGPKRAAETL